MTEDEKIAQEKAAAAASTSDAIAARRAAAAKKIAEAQQRHDEALELQEVEAEEVVAEIVAQHGPMRVTTIQTKAGPVVLERGLETLYTQFINTHKKHKGDPPYMDTRRFVDSCVAYPKTKREIEKVWSESPGSLFAAATALAGLYGDKGAEDSPK